MARQKRYIETGYKAQESYGQLIDLRFRSLVGKDNWAKLPETVKRRFSKKLGTGYSVIYKGYIQYTRMNRVGRLLAQILRPLGAPLPLDTDNDNQAAVVTVTEDLNGGGQFWTRQYGRQEGFPQVIHSTKQFTGPTGLFEYIGYGIGMSLKLNVENEALNFLSDQYFLGLGKWRLPLPKWMTPGQLHVGHADHGEGWFEFTLKLVHPVFGKLVDQSAMFCDEAKI